MGSRGWEFAVEASISPVGVLGGLLGSRTRSWGVTSGFRSRVRTGLMSWESDTKGDDAPLAASDSVVSSTPGLPPGLDQQDLRNTRGDG